jgi:hypothetical protein
LNIVERRLTAGEKTLILPETNAVDALYGLRDVSPLPVHMPGWLDRRAEQRLLRKVTADPPKAIVLFQRGNAEFRVASFGEGFGIILSDWIRRNYRVVARMEAGEILRPLARSGL